jgi:hypothetical protein
MKKTLVILLAICVCSSAGYSYGPRGHHLVGAVADRRLAKNQTVANKVKDLLDGLTLEQAATLPDEIKSWDRCGDKKKIKSAGAPVHASARINAELRAFLKANLCSSHPSHHEFHYTDVPVFAGEKYGDGDVGREDFDIVKMIPFCIRVLKDQEPQPNNRAITKSVAVILLAHYLGDIHQPLHVGAEYFDDHGQAFNPSDAHKGFADQGGNKLTLFTLMKNAPKAAGKLHSYWDGQTVNNAFGNQLDSTVANKLAKSEPADWKLTGGVETWAEQLANEILPLAREAHERLVFEGIVFKKGEKDIRDGRAVEMKKIGGKFYAIWAAGIVKSEIQKGGWRLAELLEAVLE